MDELLIKVKETLGKSEELISQAEVRLKESEDFYNSLGIKKGKATEFLNRPDLPPEMKKKIQEEREKFEQELKEELERAISNYEGGGQVKTVKGILKPNAIRI